MASSKHDPLKFTFAFAKDAEGVQMDWFQHLPLICVLHVQNTTCFGMPLGFLEHFKRSNLPTIISTNHVSKLWLLILFPPALLFHLMCCHRWAKFMKNSCILFLDSLLDMLLLFVFLVSCFAPINWSQFVVQFIVVAFLPNFRCIEWSKTQSMSIVQSRVQVLHQPRVSPCLSSTSCAHGSCYLYLSLCYCAEFSERDRLSSPCLKWFTSSH